MPRRDEIFLMPPCFTESLSPFTRSLISGPHSREFGICKRYQRPKVMVESYHNGVHLIPVDEEETSTSPQFCEEHSEAGALHYGGEDFMSSWDMGRSLPRARHGKDKPLKNASRDVDYDQLLLDQFVTASKIVRNVGSVAVRQEALTVNYRVGQLLQKSRLCRAHSTSDGNESLLFTKRRRLHDSAGSNEDLVESLKQASAVERSTLREQASRARRMALLLLRLEQTQDRLYQEILSCIDIRQPSA